MTHLSNAARELKRLTEGLHSDKLQARGEVVKLAYLLGHVPIPKLEVASKIIARRGFALFAGEAQMRAQAQAALTDRPSGQIDPLYLHIDELELSTRTSNVFQNHRSIRFVGELVQKSEDELLRIKYLGRHALKEVNRILEKLGLSLATRLSPDVFNPAKAEADWDARRQRPVDQC